MFSNSKLIIVYQLIPMQYTIKIIKSDYRFSASKKVADI